MKKKRIMCVFGTRPEAVKLAPVVKALQLSSKLEPIVALTAQHREMLDQMLSWFSIKPNFDLNLMRPGQSLSQLTASVLSEMDKLLAQNKPDFVLVQGDTATVMATALAAFYQKIPVGHVEAGLRTDNRYSPFPEEMARRQTGQLATLHFAPTKSAVENLQREGITKNVFLTGNTVIDALLDTVDRLKQTEIDKSLFGGADFERNRVILVTAHRRENWGTGISEIASALRHLVDQFPDIQILYPIHRNPIVRESVEPVFASHARLLLVEPLDYVPFVYAMQHSYLILTDSGGVQEEAPTLKKPVLVLRNNTERPEAVLTGAAQLIGTEKNKIVEATSSLLNDNRAYEKMVGHDNPYGDGLASVKIVHELERYLKGND
jgi:UDP-N-acetylglucosamine 2-epimerase (non-hydrolysing)